MPHKVPEPPKRDDGLVVLFAAMLAGLAGAAVYFEIAGDTLGNERLTTEVSDSAAAGANGAGDLP